MKKINDYESYLENPSKLLDKDFKEVNFISKGDVGQFVSEDGELTLFQRLGTEKRNIVDKKEYRKIYVEELEAIKELTTSGLKVLCYVLKNIGVKKDAITIHIQDCMEFTGYKSKVNVYSGIVDLLEKKILYRKVGSSNYFININCFYSGNR